MRHAIAALVLVGLSACDPGYRIEGTVVDSSNKPISGALVTLTWPSPSTRTPETQTVDATGHFVFGGVGGASAAGKCTLTISKLGFKSVTAPAMGVCFRSTQKGDYGEACKSGEGNITLTP